VAFPAFDDQAAARRPADPPRSPCVGTCRLEEDGAACAGCGRTLDEIRRWTRMSDVEKRAVIARVRGD
jgi:predicted Fe-S protein YdhL (DUF1289 family)